MFIDEQKMTLPLEPKVKKIVHQVEPYFSSKEKEPYSSSKEKVQDAALSISHVDCRFGHERTHHY